MAKKDVLTIDTAKASDGLRVFETKNKSFTTAYKAYQGSYLNTCGDSTVKKLNNTVKGIYSTINSLYASLKSYTASYIKSMQSLEESLRNGLIPPEEENDVQAKIAAINEILKGTEPTDIEIDPRTGEVSTNILNNRKYYGGGWNGATLYERFMTTPKTAEEMLHMSSMTGLTLKSSASEKGTDRLTHAYISHPTRTTFLSGLSPVSLEIIYGAKYNDQQLAKVKKIETDNKDAYRLGYALRVIGELALTHKLTAGEETVGVTRFAVEETPLKTLLENKKIKDFGSKLLKLAANTASENAAGQYVMLPFNTINAIGDAYDIETGKFSDRAFGASLALNTFIDFGAEYAVKAGRYALKGTVLSKLSGKGLLEEEAKKSAGVNKSSEFMQEFQNDSINRIDDEYSFAFVKKFKKASRAAGENLAGTSGDDEEQE